MKIYDNIYDYLPPNYKDEIILDTDFYVGNFNNFCLQQEDDFKKYYFSHRRNFFEISLAIKDSMHVKIGNTQFSEVENTLELVSPFQIFSVGHNSETKKYKNHSDDNIYTIFFKASFLKPIISPYQLQNEFPYFKIHSSPKYQLSKEQIKDFIDIIRIMHTYSKTENNHSIPILQSYLNILLYMIKNITNSREKIPINRFETISSKFEHYLSLSKGAFCSLTEYASMLNISSVYLSECVKKATSKSAQSVLIDYKILFMKTALTHSEKSISQIAEEMAYNELTNFTKFFKKHTGITPKQFKHNITNT